MYNISCQKPFFPGQMQTAHTPQTHSFRERNEPACPSQPPGVFRPGIRDLYLRPARLSPSEHFEAAGYSRPGQLSLGRHHDTDLPEDLLSFTGAWQMLRRRRRQSGRRQAGGARATQVPPVRANLAAVWPNAAGHLRLAQGLLCQTRLIERPAGQRLTPLKEPAIASRGSTCSWSCSHCWRTVGQYRQREVSALSDRTTRRAPSNSLPATVTNRPK